MKRILTRMIGVLVCGLSLSPRTATAQQALVVKALAEKKITDLPAGPLYWRLENFPTRAQAEAAAGPVALVAQSRGKIWLFTLGPSGGSSPGGSKVAEVGPLPKVVAKEYLLRINEASGPPGSITTVHTHPGSEAFYVLAGEQSIRTPDGTIRVSIGQPETGPGGDTPLQVSNSGSTELHALVMFLVDATKPFSSPAKLH
jgi:quercetin dioxygenase-like cupin family protein